MRSAQLLRESGIRKLSGAPVVAMLDFWHELCQQHVGTTLEVVIMNRRDNPLTKDIEGMFCTALPMGVPFGLVLGILMDPEIGLTNKIIWTHELGHWILKLQGFQPIRDPKEHNSDREMQLNELAQHFPLYELQRSFGIDPQEMIDPRKIQQVKIFSRDPEPQQRAMRIVNALRLAVDMEFCSADLRDQLLKIVEQRHRHIGKFLQVIMDTMKHYNLLDQGENKKFLRKVVQNLKMGAGWKFENEIKLLREVVKTDEGRPRLPGNSNFDQL